jgi:hypothetical protein
MDAVRKLKLLCEFLEDADPVQKAEMVAELVTCIDEIIQERDTYRRALSLDGRSSWAAR